MIRRIPAGPSPASPTSDIPAGQEPLPGFETPHELQPAGRFDWERVIYRITSESVAWRFTMLVLAGHADPDGTRVRPGVPLLMDITRASDTTVRRRLRRACELGLLEVVHRGGGRAGAATEYRLTVPADLFDLVEMLPVQRPSDAPPNAPAKPRPRRATRRETQVTMVTGVPDDTPGNTGHLDDRSSETDVYGTQVTIVTGVPGTPVIDPPLTCGDVAPPSTYKSDQPVRDKVSTSPALRHPAADPQKRSRFDVDGGPPPPDWRPPRRRPKTPPTHRTQTPPGAPDPPDDPPTHRPHLTTAEVA